MSPLSRRGFLRGAGGVALALPWLEALAPSTALAQAAAPRRYLVGFGGCSLGGTSGSIADTVLPSVVGVGYDLKPALARLAPVRDEVTVVSGLSIPTAVAGVVPAGGRPVNFHGYQLAPLMTGTRSVNGGFTSPTSDQVAAQFLGATPFGSLAVCVQASTYIGTAAPGSGPPLSFRQGSSGLEPVVSRVSPQQLFLALFGGFSAPGITPAEAAHQRWLLDTRTSLLDAVAKRFDAVARTLGKTDRQRLDAHLWEVRQLEQRVRALDRPEAGQCQRPADPGADPPMGANQTFGSGGTITYQPDRAYSGEDTRAQVMCELIHMALTCDLTRSVMFQLSLPQSFLSMQPLSGQRSDLHGLSHGSYGNRAEPDDTQAMAPGIDWHVKHWAYLLQKLKGTPEAGGTLLDQVATVFTFEGGQGFDPENNLTVSPHSTEGMVCLAAGGGFSGGIHLPASGLHPAQVMLTGLRAAGCPVSGLGEVQAEVPGLRT